MSGNKGKMGTKAGDERRGRGFESAAGLLRKPIRAAGEKRGFAVSRVLTHWAEIAGAEIAAMSRPVRIGYGREGMGGTLTLLTTGAAAPMLQMRLPALRDKVNACYGYNAISRITLTQTAATGFAEGQAEFTQAPKPAPAEPAPETRRAAAEAAQGIGDDALRGALAALAEKVLSRRDRPKG